MTQPANSKEECECDACRWPHYHIVSYVDVHAKLMAMAGMLELLHEKHTQLTAEHGEMLRRQAGDAVDPTRPTAGGASGNEQLRLADDERSGSRRMSERDGHGLEVPREGSDDGGSSRGGGKGTAGDDVESPEPDEQLDEPADSVDLITPRGQMMATTTAEFDKAMVCMELIEMLYSQVGGVKRAFLPGSIRMPLDFIDGFFNSKFQKSQLDVIMRPYRGLTKPVKESKSDEGSWGDLAINAFAEMIQAMFAKRFRDHEVQDSLIAVLKMVTSKEYTGVSRRGKPTLALVLARTDFDLLEKACPAAPGEQLVDRVSGTGRGNPPKSAVSSRSNFTVRTNNSDGRDGSLPGLNPPPPGQLRDYSGNGSNAPRRSPSNRDCLAPGDSWLQSKSVPERRLLKSGSSNQARIKMLEDQVSGLTSLVETIMGLQGELPEKEKKAFANGLKRVRGYEQSRAAMARVMAVSSNSASVVSRVGSSRSISSTKSGASVKDMRAIRDSLLAAGRQRPNTPPPEIRATPSGATTPFVELEPEPQSRPSSVDSLESSFSSISSFLDF